MPVIIITVTITIKHDLRLICIQFHDDIVNMIFLTYENCCIFIFMWLWLAFQIYFRDNILKIVSNGLAVKNNSTIYSALINNIIKWSC